MMKKNVELLSQILRELESEIGTSDLANLVLIALVDAVGALRVKNSAEFCEQFHKLLDAVSATEPKFGILSHRFDALFKYFSTTVCCKNCSEVEWKKEVIESINDILITAHQEKAQLIYQSNQVNVEGKTILIHDHSHTVQKVLAHFKNIGRNFKVVIAEQDFEKTHSNIESMHKAGIEFQVVPAYMLSHVHKQIDMLFFGALTLKDTMDFVMDPGTLGTISEFHEEGIPVYMFIDSAKFSLWKSKRRGEIFIHRDKRKHAQATIEYERIKYSHDRVPIKLFYRIVTNEGVFTPAELEKRFHQKMEEYSKQA